MHGLLLCNGEIKSYKFLDKYLETAPYIICADGGANHAYNLRLIPDMIVGDLDSIKDHVLDFYREKNVTIKEFPTNKDVTDTELAMDIFINEIGATSITIAGAIGSRLDHTLANIAVLKRYPTIFTMVDDRNEIVVVDKSVEITKTSKNMKVSLLPATETVKGVCTKGLLYPLYNAILRYDNSLGISNEITEDKCSINIEDGLLYVITSMD